MNLSSNGNIVYSASESLSLGIACSLIASVYLPLYMTLIWILATNDEYDRVIFYRILAHLSVANVLSLTSAFTGGIFELTRATFYPAIGNTAGSFSAWFRIAYTFLNIILCVNQLSVVFDFNIPYENDVHKYFVFLLWYALVVLVLMTVYLDFDFSYDFATHYFHDPTQRLELAINVVRHTTTVVYLIVICKLLYSKFVRRESLEETSLRILYRAFAVHFPTGIHSTIYQLFSKNIEASDVVRIPHLIFFRSLSALTITIVLLLDRNLRSEVHRLAKKAKSRCC
ncbi:hypothetical protein QR680_009861 [Steinernema hermaphroditum]|uniref:Uncharacterized protein n=1 Tax=Steinernema hermaphroditum TaxID=289476 RepID=A0AA39ILW8_9BILA|nr:hypothetical protein QR680_009861 [Steinernema hermaphroditum]